MSLIDTGDMGKEVVKVGELNGAWTALLRVFLLIWIPLEGWQLWHHMSLSNQQMAVQNAMDVRMTAIEANRFTAADGMKLYDELSHKYDKRTDPVPPQWFHDMVKEVRDDIDEISRRLTNIEQRLPAGRRPDYSPTP